jgi:hypothetical protein
MAKAKDDAGNPVENRLRKAVAELNDALVEADAADLHMTWPSRRADLANPEISQGARVERVAVAPDGSTTPVQPEPVDEAKA